MWPRLATGEGSRRPTAGALLLVLLGVSSVAKGLELLPESKSLAVGDHVTWTKTDKDVPSGNIGTVVRVMPEGYLVKFLKGQWGFKADQLVKMSFVVGDRVTWNRVDSDVPAGSVGIVKRLAGDGLVVQFPGGKWLFNPNNLRLAPKTTLTTTTTELTFDSSKATVPTSATDFETGDKVVWSKANGEVPTGSIGTIVRITDSTVIARFRKGQWAFDPEQMHKVATRVGERVTWTRKDKDVPAGSVGVVEAFGISGALVHFPGGRWLFNPDQLRQSFASTSTSTVTSTSTSTSTKRTTTTSTKETTSTATSTVTSTSTSSSTVAPTSSTATTATRTSTSTAPTPAPSPSPIVTSTTTAQVVTATTFAIGQRVMWTKEDEDIPRGTIGTVVRQKGDDAVVVQFPKGRWGFHMEQLRAAPSPEEERVDAASSEGGFCCFAAQDESSDVCGTCHPTGRAGSESFCGRSRNGCKDCGGLAWCGTRKGDSSAISQVVMRKDSAGGVAEETRDRSLEKTRASDLLWLSLPALLLTAAVAFAMAGRRWATCRPVQHRRSSDVCGQPLVRHEATEEDVEG